MVQPMDYTLDVVQPFDRALQGFNAGLGIREAGQMEQVRNQAMDIAGSREDRAQQQFGMEQYQFAQEQSALQQAQARAQATQDALMELAENPDAGADDFARVIMQFPEVAESTTQAFEVMDAGRKQATLKGALQVYTALKGGNVEAARGLLEDRMTAAQASGDTEAAQAAEASLGILDIDPDALKASLGLSIKAVGGSEYDDMLTPDRVQSTQAVGPRISVQTMSSGETRVVDTTTNTVLRGKEAEDAINEAERAQAAQVEAEAFGRGVGTETVKLGREALDGLKNVRSQLRTYDEAIAAIDDGAKSGIVASFFPNVTKASAELENSMNRLGLDVIGSVTFGALSEGEMRLAMDTAVPRGLGPQALRKWFVEKKAAQQKAAVALSNAARVLMVEGDLSEYIRAQTVTDQGAAPAASPTQGAPVAASQPIRKGGRNTPRTGVDLSPIESGVSDLERMLQQLEGGQ